MSVRPVVVGDILSFNREPEKFEDLMVVTVKWQQDFKDRSEKYYCFKAKNITAGDTEYVVPVFAQESYYEHEFGKEKEAIVEFVIKEEQWQYGQRDETGADRFLVLHDQKNEPFQHRFVSSWLVKLASFGHGLASAGGYAYYADKIDALGKTYLGDPLHSFVPPIAQSGDVLLVPSTGGDKKTVEWRQSLVSRSGEYYLLHAINTTQSGRDVTFFIQKEWWDDGSSAEPHHISKIANKNANGQYELKLDNKCQYGQADKTGKARWVVYHDKEREPFQHRFIKSALQNGAAKADQILALAKSFGVPVPDLRVSEVLKPLESIFGDDLHTFD